jgi:hypothetical protein
VAVDIELGVRQLACVDETGRTLLSAGRLQFEIGGAEMPAIAEVVVMGATVELEI